MRVQFGVALHSVDYTLHQLDHVTRLGRIQHESWVEWTRTWGLAMRFPDLELRYMGQQTTGAGRPGVVSNGGVVRDVARPAAVGQNFISAPSGATTLTGVAVTTHQFSVSIPVR